MKAHWFSPVIRRIAVREWLILFAAMLLLAIGLGAQNGLGRLDQTLYDQFTKANGRPARNDIIIVAIDDFSLSELGRWPWPRKLHADLIQKINQAKPLMIGVDLIFSEPEQATVNGIKAGDTDLARALSQSNKVVLPVIATDNSSGLSALMPIPELANAARAIGHIHLEHDGDGVVRSVFLREVKNGVWWQHFARTLIDPGNKSPAPLPPAQPDLLPSSNHWQRIEQMHIAFAGNNGHFQSVPYVSVLRGEVAPQFFQDKYVLIGATARGMADAHPTPVSAGSGAMPGIEIHANILAGLLDSKSVTIAPAWLTALFCTSPVMIALFAYLVLPPRISLITLVALLFATVFVSYLALCQGVWIAPSAALITLIISYPLWSWRRLEAAIAYLGQEFIRLELEPRLLPEAEPTAHRNQSEDALERNIKAMTNAVHRACDLRQFVSDSLDNLSDATLITTVDGQVILANKAAQYYFSSIVSGHVIHAQIRDLLAYFHSPLPVDLPNDTQFQWGDLLDMRCNSAFLNGIETQGAKGGDFLVKCAPCQSSKRTLVGWIISIIDVSPIRAAERSRDEALRFLSHDMRAPQASILALLELQSEPESALPQNELFSRIENASRKTLGLAENFVQLARAESQEYRLEEIDFQDLLLDASDEMWSLAKAKNITLQTHIPEDEFILHADRTLMTRALTNLISNAINYSPEHTEITCALKREITDDTAHIICTISDQGYGIAEDDRDKLFQRFQRVSTPNQPTQNGSGLGLVFVKTVIERHHGQLSFVSEVGKGTRFLFELPC